MAPDTSTGQNNNLICKIKTAHENGDLAMPSNIDGDKYNISKEKKKSMKNHLRDTSDGNSFT